MSNAKIENIGFHHVAVAVSNMEKSIEFYTEGLGFKLVTLWGEGDKRIALLDIGNGVHFELFANGTSEPQGNEKITHVAFLTTDTDSAYKAAIAAGATSHWEPIDLTMGDPPAPIRVAFVRGLDGELLEFIMMRQ